MKLRTVLCVVAIAGLSTACAQKEKKELKKETQQTEQKVEKNSSSLSYACLVGKDLRRIETEKTTKRCEIHYTKFGEKSQVAWAEATPKICSRVRDQIRKNIESKGYKCDSDIANLTKERKTASN